MNRGRIFRRRVDTGLGRLQETAGHLQERMKDQASALADQTREGLTRSRDTLMSWEHAMERNIRQNRALYIATLGVLVGLIAAKLILDWRESKRDEIPLGV